MLVLVAIEVVLIIAGEIFDRVKYGTCIGG
jgi:hypothetical protein